MPYVKAVLGPFVFGGLDRFFATALERERIRLRREAGLEPPWTADPILQQFRFCNLRREDDRTTRWFRKWFRGPHRADSRVLLGTVIFRWFNRIETGRHLMFIPEEVPPGYGENIRPSDNLLLNWDPDSARRRLQHVSPLVTGAYMIKTPPRVTKLEGLIWCIDNVWGDREELHQLLESRPRLQDLHRVLKSYPYLGDFMAYEIVSDLRWTEFLSGAEDVLSWAVPGPGARRGLRRLFGPLARSEELEAMRSLLAEARRRDWPEGRPWEMREVEHWLCEFDKYMRAEAGERLKRRYP